MVCWKRSGIRQQVTRSSRRYFLPPTNALSCITVAEAAGRTRLWWNTSATAVAALSLITQAAWPVNSLHEHPGCRSHLNRPKYCPKVRQVTGIHIASEMWTRVATRRSYGRRPSPAQRNRTKCKWFRKARTKRQRSEPIYSLGQRSRYPPAQQARGQKAALFAQFTNIPSGDES